MEAMLFSGELERSEVMSILGVQERQARRITSSLLEQDILVSPTSKAPLRLNFPARLAGAWMPGLFPEKDG